MKKFRLLFFAAALFAAFPAAALELRAGTAKAVITPDDPQGRIMVMGNGALGVKRDIWARVLTLSDGRRRLVIVSYDLNCLDVATPLLRSRARRELGLEPEYLLLFATHNHAAPIQIAPSNFDYGRRLADRLFALIQEAIAAEAGPARVYFSTGHTDLLRADPRYPQIYGVRGPAVDDEIQALTVERGGKPVAVFFNLPTHPMQSSFWRIETGHPGFAVEELERQFPGALALYDDAAGGDQFIRSGFVMFNFNCAVKRTGRRLAGQVADLVRGPRTEVTGPLAASLTVLSLPLAPPLSLDDARKLAAQKHVPTDIGFVPYPDPQRENNWLRSLLDHYAAGRPFPTRSDQRICTDDGFLVEALPEPREFPCRYEEIIVVRIGPMALAAMQGEVCAAIGKRIKAQFQGRFPLMLNGYLGEHNLYIPTRALVEINAYQAQVIQTQYASPVGWAPEVEDEMVAGTAAAIEAVMAADPE